MLINEFKGLKYPDEYVTRFFFKEKLHLRTGNVLELGCGNGCNLSLFFQYGYDTVGVDISPEEIANGKDNFNRLKNGYGLKNLYKFHQQDMIAFLSGNRVTFDTILLPSSIYYLSYESIKRVLGLIKENAVKKGSHLFIRVRTPEDYRFGKGSKIDDNCFLLDIDITGEKGCLNTFLTEKELLSLAKSLFTFESSRLLHLSFDNVQNNCIIANRDIIFWGQVA